MKDSPSLKLEKYGYNRLILEGERWEATSSLDPVEFECHDVYVSKVGGVSKVQFVVVHSGVVN